MLAIVKTLPIVRVRCFSSTPIIAGLVPIESKHGTAVGTKSHHAAAHSALRALKKKHGIGGTATIVDFHNVLFWLAQMKERVNILSRREASSIKKSAIYTTVLAIESYLL
jgi:hypothetical protein